MGDNSMSAEMREKIDEFRDSMQIHIALVHTNDEILNVIYHRMWKNVLNELETIWFYHDALVKRSITKRLRSRTED